MLQPFIHSHRFARQIIESTPELARLWDELLTAILEISDVDLINEFLSVSLADVNDVDSSNLADKMSLSDSINRILDRKLVKLGWTPQSALFQDEEYSASNETRWRLDFSKTVPLEESLEPGSNDSNSTGMAVEVAFNHGEAIAWNLLKPVIAGELNHVEKQTEIGSGIGVVICAAKELKVAGAFDGAVGEYEKFLRYLKPMRNQLTTPMLIIGLRAPETFVVKKMKDPVTKTNKGSVRLT